METEKSEHGTEEGLILAQLGASKLCNGSRSPDTSPQRVNGDNSWGHFRPVKRHSSSPATMFDRMNGETQHDLQSLTASQQPKRFCANSETNPWDGKETDIEGCLELVDKGYCNGDVYSTPTNKQVQMQNGATVTPPSVEGPSSDLSEKMLTQSQCNPENATATLQKSDEGILHEQAVTSSSGFSISAEPPAQIPAEAHGRNAYDPAFMVNGYSVNFKAEERQQVPHPHANPPDLVNHLQSELGMGPASSSDHSLNQNSSECFASNPEGLCMFSNSHHKFSPGSYPLPEGAQRRSLSSSAPGQENSTVTNQQHLNYGMQPHQTNVSNAAHRVATPPVPPQQIMDKLDSLDQGGSMDPDTKMSWNNVNSAPSPQHRGSQPNTWSFPSNENSRNQSEELELDSSQQQQNCPPQVQNAFKMSTPPTQPQHHAASEPGIPKSPSDMHTLQNKLQPQQQVAQQFCHLVQQQQLCNNDQNLDQVLPPDFLCQQPSQPQKQYNVHQQQVGPMQHHDAQCLNVAPQSQNSYQGQPPNPWRQTMVNHTQQDTQSLTYRSPKPPAPVQTGTNQLVHPNHTVPNQSRPHSQPLPNDVAFMFGLGDATEIPQQRQRQYSPSPNALHCHYSQQPLTPVSLNNSNFQNSPHAQQQPQLTDGALGQQMPAKMFPKAESQQSCFPFQRGPMPSPGAQTDFKSRAVLRMHFLQKQERLPQCQSPSKIRPDFKWGNNLIRMPVPQMQHQVQDMASGTLVMVKQERPSSACEQSQLKSILATMEQQLQQYQPSSVFERKSLVIKSPNKVKVEMSGGLAVVSTNLEGKGGDQRKPSNCTPKKEPGLQCFLDSPMKLLDTPIKNLLDTPLKTQYEFPPCHCVEQISEKDEGPYYTHLGAAPNIKGIREMMEKRSGLTGGAIRIEKVIYTGKEGKSAQGCPIAKWVIRRASVDEKLLVLVRERVGHFCQTSCMVVVIVIWEGIQQSLADQLYTELSDTLTKHGTLTNRRCALNEERTCACQGLDPDACGASFSFGCSWSMYYNGCKFARSKIPRKFKLLGDDPKEEEKLERNLQDLATLMAPMYKQMAPEAYSNQVEHEHRAPDCRLGLKEGRPFSGVTACLDFCAHAHRDLHNMPGGSTVVCTLTRQDNRKVGNIPDDEQLHVLPLYKAATTDEFGSAEGQLEKTKTGAIQVLSAFRRQVRMLAEPAKSCRQRKLESKKSGANKSSHLNTPNSKADQQAKLKQSSYEGLGQNKLPTGADLGHMGAPLQLGQHSLAAPNKPQQQHQQHPSTVLQFSGSTAHVNYPRFPNTSGSFPSTSIPASLFPQPPRSASAYHSPLPVPNSYTNGSNPTNPYPTALPSNNIYPGYQCNGGIPMDIYHPYYPNPKHLDMYRHPRPALYPDQQLSPHQQYAVSYPANYGKPGLPINGYGNTIRPNMHHIEQYPSYTPTGRPEAHFLDAITSQPPAHPSLDYTEASKCSQMGRYPNAYIPQNHPMQLAQHMDPLRMQIKPEMNVFPQVLSPFGRDVINSCQPLGMSMPNGNSLPPIIKQEPGLVTPAPAPEEEDIWSDSEHNFLDPEIGGIAVAPSHGSILIECAKRELHATTPLKKPDRTHPTRISLVFYQHKNLNEAKHGIALWEAKMAEKAREKEEDAEKHSVDDTPSKSNKRVKKEYPEHSETSEPPYKRFIQRLAEKSQSCTTNTYTSSAPYAFTKVTGPYSHFL